MRRWGDCPTDSATCSHHNARRSIRIRAIHLDDLHARCIVRYTPLAPSLLQLLNPFLQRGDFLLGLGQRGALFGDDGGRVA